MRLKNHPTFRARGSCGAALQLAVLATMLTCVALNAGAAQTIALIVPNNLTNQYGGSKSRTPFSDTSSSTRYQQVYDASQFAAIRQYGGWIAHIGFRPLYGGGSSGCSSSLFLANMSSLQVNLSTTASGPDGLSWVYAENVGADETIVFGPAARDMTTLACGDPACWNESAALHLTTPFFYDPKKGNLLMDVFNYFGSTAEGGCLDATDQLGDSVSRVYGAIGLDAAFVRSSVGLITRFEVIPAPPSPPLGIKRSGPAAVLRWPTNAVGFVLESTTALGTPSPWAAVTNLPVATGTNNVVTNNLVGTSQFYRLRYELKP